VTQQVLIVAMQTVAKSIIIQKPNFQYG